MISVALILHMMAVLPTECSLYAHGTGGCAPGTLGHYETRKDSRAIAQAISENATDERDAFEQVEYAAYESDNDLGATGDSGRSHGAWQIPWILVDARSQLRAWIRLRNYSVQRCGSNPENARNAHLASGSCILAIRKVSRRYDLITRLLPSLETNPQGVQTVTQ